MILEWIYLHIFLRVPIYLAQIHNSNFICWFLLQNIQSDDEERTVLSLCLSSSEDDVSFIFNVKNVLLFITIKIKSNWCSLHNIVAIQRSMGLIFVPISSCRKRTKIFWKCYFGLYPFKILFQGDMDMDDSNESFSVLIPKLTYTRYTSLKYKIYVCITDYYNMLCLQNEKKTQNTIKLYLTIYV